MFHWIRKWTQGLHAGEREGFNGEGFYFLTSVATCLYVMLCMWAIWVRFHTENTLHREKHKVYESYWPPHLGCFHSLCYIPPFVLGDYLIFAMPPIWTNSLLISVLCSFFVLAPRSPLPTPPSSLLLSCACERGEAFRFFKLFQNLSAWAQLSLTVGSSECFLII